MEAAILQDPGDAEVSFPFILPGLERGGQRVTESSARWHFHQVKFPKGVNVAKPDMCLKVTNRYLFSNQICSVYSAQK